MNRAYLETIVKELDQVQENISCQFDTVWNRLAFDQDTITKFIVDELLDETVKYLSFMQERLNEIKELVDRPGWSL